MGLIQNKVTVSQPNSHVVVKNAGGLRGLTGETGPQGPQGVPGDAATVTVGTTTTLPAGSDATVQNVGSTSAAIFNFGIPKGDKGDTGETGAAATISVGTTTTLEPGEDATVTNSGTSSAAVFDFGIPKGAKGDTGSQGPAGQDGADGFSPTATVTKTGDTATITITDKDGTTTASISDGTTPTVNDGTLTIQKNGTTVQTFSADQASNVTANITVPTQFSDLSGTVSSSQIEDEAITTGSVSGTGTNITLAGTMEGGVIESVELNGNTTQTTISGKNLYLWTPSATQQQGLISTYNSTTGMVNVSGTSNASWSDIAQNFITAIPAGRYTLSVTKPLPFTITLRWTKDDDSYYDRTLAAGLTSATYNNLEPCKRVRVFLGTTSGTTYNETFGFMLESGQTATSFEPYVGGTASPNPDYPQAVQTVTGEQTITISDGAGNEQVKTINLGKNLFNKDSFPSVDGFIRADNYTLTSSASNKTTYIKVDPNTTYTFSGFALGVALVVGTFNKVPELGDVANVRVLKGASDTTVTITTGASDSYIAFMYQTSSDTLDTSAFQIEKGSVATTYAPYFTPIELCKIGDYQDYIYKSGEDWYVHKDIKKLDMSTINAWALDVAGRFYRVGFSSTYGITPGILYSNDFTYSATAWSGAGKFGLPDSGNIWLMISDTTVSHSGLPTWLGNKGAVMYGILTTPTDTQITNATLISELEDLLSTTTYSGNTYITVSGDLASPLEVVAEADSKLAPDSVYGAAIKDGAVSVDKIADLKALADALAPYLNS